MSIQEVKGYFMTTTRTPEQEAIYQQFLSEATEMVVEMNRRISEQGSKETNFCGPGCSNCCCQVFHVKALEFEVILKRIVNDPELLRRFKEQYAQRELLTTKHLEKIKEISRITDDIEFNMQWIKLKIPCALLYDNKCIIYEVRPETCATYQTLSPPRVCAIDPKGYLSVPMKKLKGEYREKRIKLDEKYRRNDGLIFDLSWYLAQALNPPQEEPVKQKRKKKT